MKAYVVVAIWMGVCALVSSYAVNEEELALAELEDAAGYFEEDLSTSLGDTGCSCGGSSCTCQLPLENSQTAQLKITKVPCRTCSCLRVKYQLTADGASKASGVTSSCSFPTRFNFYSRGQYYSYFFQRTGCPHCCCRQLTGNIKELSPERKLIGKIDLKKNAGVTYGGDDWE